MACRYMTGLRQKMERAEDSGDPSGGEQDFELPEMEMTWHLAIEAASEDL